MTSLDSAHEDVAAYALNLMEPDEAWRFELHLLTCEQCTTALAEFTPVADVLAEVDAGDLIAANQMFREGRVLDGMLDAAARQRGRTRALRLVSVAAGVVVLVIISVLTAAVGWGGIWPGSAPGNVAGGSNAPQNRQGTQPRPNQGQPLEPTPGLCAGAADERFEHTDAATGAKAQITVSCRTWGTPVQVTLYNVVGPMQCTVVVRTKAGKETTVLTVPVPPGPHGNNDNPDPLSLKTVSDVFEPEIAQIDVMQRDTGGGSDKRLVSVTMK